LVLITTTTRRVSGFAVRAAVVVDGAGLGSLGAGLHPQPSPNPTSKSALAMSGFNN
jgi:hypothetical protein